MSRSDPELVAEALYHLEILRQHLAESDLSNVIVVDAVSLRLAAAIEVLSRASQALRDRVVGDEWPKAWSTRNRIAHAYAAIDVDMIRSSVELDLPRIEAALHRERALG